MFLNLETDYAIRIVQCLAAEGRLDAKSIAAATGVTPRFTLKILHGLVAAGIVKSFKGAQGGYTLAKSAEETTLLEVVETVNGSLGLASCQSENGCTHPNGFCGFRTVFDDVTGYMRAKFSKETFKKD